MLKDFNPKDGAIGGAVVGVLWLGVWGIKKLIQLNEEDKKIREDLETSRRDVEDAMDKLTKSVKDAVAKAKEMADENDRLFKKAMGPDASPKPPLNRVYPADP